MLLDLFLRLAMVGTFLSFAKLSYFAFFEKNERIQAKESPWNMQCAMIITALLCILIGIFPAILFHILPYASTGYHAYTPSHIAGVFQFFLIAGLVFMLAKNAFSPHRWIILDFDYFYRMAFRGVAWLCRGPLNDFRLRTQAAFSRTVSVLVCLSRDPFSLPEILAKYGRMDRREAFSSLEAVCNKEEPRYDENLYRKPMGLGVLLAILFLFFYGLVYFLNS
jgi:multicomponent Na+:H+ antiporter subunit D